MSIRIPKESGLARIEAAKLENARLIRENPYFKASENRALLQQSLLARDYTALQALSKDPHLLIINEKFRFILQGGEEKNLTPLEYAISQDDRRAFQLISSSPAFDKELPPPNEALQQLNKEQAKTYLKLYLSLKPCWIDSEVMAQGFAPLAHCGRKGLAPLQQYYKANVISVNENSISSFVCAAERVMNQEFPSAAFNQAYQQALECIASPLFNLDAILNGNDRHLCQITRFFSVLLGEHCTAYAQMEKKRPYLFKLLEILFREKKFRKDREAFRQLRPFPPISKAHFPEVLPLDSRARALHARANIVTLIGKISHEADSASCKDREIPQQLCGGNKPYRMLAFIDRLLHYSHSELISKAVYHVLKLYGHQNPGCGYDGTAKEEAHRIQALLDTHAPLCYLTLKTKGHSHALVFYENYFIICDRALVLTSKSKETTVGASLMIFRFKNRSSTPMWEDFLLNSHQAVLDCIRLSEVRYLDAELHRMIPLKPQKHFNCIWASNISLAIQVVAQLQKDPEALLTKGRFDPELMDAMHQFNHCAKRVSVEAYVSEHRAALKDSPIEPDATLSAKAFLYFLKKCSVQKKHSDRHYRKAMELLLYSGFKLSKQELEPHRDLLKFLEERYRVSTENILDSLCS